MTDRETYLNKVSRDTGWATDSAMMRDVADRYDEAEAEKAQTNEFFAAFDTFIKKWQDASAKEIHRGVTERRIGSRTHTIMTELRVLLGHVMRHPPQAPAIADKVYVRRKGDDWQIWKSNTIGQWAVVAVTASVELAYTLCRSMGWLVLPEEKKTSKRSKEHNTLQRSLDFVLPAYIRELDDRSTEEALSTADGRQALRASVGHMIGELKHIDKLV